MLAISLSAFLLPLLASLWSAQPLPTRCVIFTSKSCGYTVSGIDFFFLLLTNASDGSLHCHTDVPMTSTVILKAQ